MTCGMSVVDNFHRFRKFNVRSIIEPPVKQVQDKKEEEGNTEEKKVEENPKEEEPKDESSSTTEE